MKRQIAVVVLTLSTGILVPNVAKGHDHEVPRVVSRRGGEQIQVGVDLASCWVQPSDTSDYTVACRDYPWRFPKMDRVRASQRLVLRIKKELMPTETLIHAWPRLDEETGEPSGKAIELEHLSRPVVNENDLTWAWDLVFELPEPSRRYYIRLSGEWPDEEFPQESQTAQWTFFLRSRATS